MSYSRWSDSFWYTYWAVGDEDDSMDEQVFQICLEDHFTYRELKDNMERCVQTVANTGAGPEELEELRGYMRRFMRDVEKKFKKEKEEKKKDE